MALTLKGVGTSLLRQLQLPLAAPPPQAHGKDEWKLGEKHQVKFCRTSLSLLQDIPRIL